MDSKDSLDVFSNEILILESTEQEYIQIPMVCDRNKNMYAY